ncbi:ABC transporter substrate-binding protein [Serinibacter arcticus]|uniref:ABC transporter substrate-binding protein n=1 Tax=Serinibacter arcticus TaxID=1655435 RepID=UPI0013049BC0|nr:ABC transporter substrate-binding protein [Serinibacter arcticus]
MRRTLAGTSLLAAAALLLTACANPEPVGSSGQTSSSTSAAEGATDVADPGDSTIRYALWSNPNGTFNPLTYFTDYDRAIVFNVYSRLVIVDENQGFTPQLAEGYEWSEDGRTLTFTLPGDVTWHDGEPFTAEDVAFTYSIQGSADWPRDTPAFITEVEGFEEYHSGAAATVSGIQVIDPTTVSFTFTQPYSAALSHFADRPVLAKHIWETVPVADWDTSPQAGTPVGTGPFKFVTFLPDQYVELERNEEYLHGAPKAAKLIFTVTSPETVQTQLVNGELDIAELSSWNPTELTAYEDAGIRVDEQAGTSLQSLTLDANDERLQDVRVRQAIVTAINRTGIVDSLLYGHGAVSNTIGSPLDPAYPDDLDTYDHDPEAAAALLAEAGWVDTDGDGVVEKDGEPFTFVLNFPTGNKTREQSAPIIQQNLQEIGLDVELVSGDFNSTLAILQDPAVPYDGVLMGGTFRPGNYDNNFWWERFEDPELTALHDTVVSTVEPEPYAEAVSAWFREVNELAFRVWLYIPNRGYASRPEVQGVATYPYEPFFGVENWYVGE